MRIIETKAYFFNELSDKGKERAMSWYLEHLTIDLDTDYHKDLLAEHAFLDAKIEYSGFSSQGDGGSFTADIDTDRFLVGKYEALKDVDFELKITAFNSPYWHKRTKRVEAFIYNATKEEIELITELETELETIRLDLCDTIYSALEADYEYQTSLEYVSEYMEQNEYEFDEEGRII